VFLTGRAHVRLGDLGCAKLMKGGLARTQIGAWRGGGGVGADTPWKAPWGTRRWMAGARLCRDSAHSALHSNSHAACSLSCCRLRPAGTPYYMSPEIWANHLYDAKSECVLGRQGGGVGRTREGGLP
jgi:hypothetical protein